jgi:hypothetical protein
MRRIAARAPAMAKATSKPGKLLSTRSPCFLFSCWYCLTGILPFQNSLLSDLAIVFGVLCHFFKELAKCLSIEFKVR